LRVGTPQSLSPVQEYYATSIATAVYLDEYTRGGSLVTTVALPSATDSAAGRTACTLSMFGIADGRMAWAVGKTDILVGCMQLDAGANTVDGAGNLYMAGRVAAVNLASGNVSNWADVRTAVDSVSAIVPVDASRAYLSGQSRGGVRLPAVGSSDNGFVIVDAGTFSRFLRGMALVNNTLYTLCAQYDAIGVYVVGAVGGPAPQDMASPSPLLLLERTPGYPLPFVTHFAFESADSLFVSAAAFLDASLLPGVLASVWHYSRGPGGKWTQDGSYVVPDGLGAQHLTPAVEGGVFYLYVAASLQSTGTGVYKLQPATGNWTTLKRWGCCGASVRSILIDNPLAAVATALPSLTQTASFTATPSASVTRSPTVSTTGSMSGSVSGSMSGSVSGSVSGTVSGSVSGTRSWTPSYTISLTASTTPSPLPSLSITVTASTTSSGTGSQSGTGTGSTTATPTYTASMTPSPSSSLTRTATGTPTSTASMTVGASASGSASGSATGTLSHSGTVSGSHSGTGSVSGSHSGTSSASSSSSGSGSVSATGSGSRTPSATMLASQSHTDTGTGSSTGSASVTSSGSATASHTTSATASASGSASWSSSIEASATTTPTTSPPPASLSPSATTPPSPPPSPSATPSVTTTPQPACRLTVAYRFNLTLASVNASALLAPGVGGAVLCTLRHALAALHSNATTCADVAVVSVAVEDAGGGYMRLSTGAVGGSCELCAGIVADELPPSLSRRRRLAQLAPATMPAAAAAAAAGVPRVGGSVACHHRAAVQLQRGSRGGKGRALVGVEGVNAVSLELRLPPPPAFPPQRTGRAVQAAVPVLPCDTAAGRRLTGTDTSGGAADVPAGAATLRVTVQVTEHEHVAVAASCTSPQLAALAGTAWAADASGTRAAFKRNVDELAAHAWSNTTAVDSTPFSMPRLAASAALFDATLALLVVGDGGGNTTSALSADVASLAACWLAVAGDAGGGGSTLAGPGTNTPLLGIVAGVVVALVVLCGATLACMYCRFRASLAKSGRAPPRAPDSAIVELPADVAAALDADTVEGVDTIAADLAALLGGAPQLWDGASPGGDGDGGGGGGGTGSHNADDAHLLALLEAPLVEEDAGVGDGCGVAVARGTTGAGIELVEVRHEAAPAHDTGGVGRVVLRGQSKRAAATVANPMAARAGTATALAALAGASELTALRVPAAQRAVTILPPLAALPAVPLAVSNPPDGGGGGGGSGVLMPDEDGRARPAARRRGTATAGTLLHALSASTSSWLLTSRRELVQEPSLPVLPPAVVGDGDGGGDTRRLAPAASANSVLASIHGSVKSSRAAIAGAAAGDHGGGDDPLPLVELEDNDSPLVVTVDEGAAGAEAVAIAAATAGGGNTAGMHAERRGGVGATVAGVTAVSIQAAAHRQRAEAGATTPAASLLRRAEAVLGDRVPQHMLKEVVMVALDVAKALVAESAAAEVPPVGSTSVSALGAPGADTPAPPPAAASKEMLEAVLATALAAAAAQVRRGAVVDEAAPLDGAGARGAAAGSEASGSGAPRTTLTDAALAAIIQQSMAAGRKALTARAARHPTLVTSSAKGVVRRSSMVGFANPMLGSNTAAPARGGKSGKLSRDAQSSQRRRVQPKQQRAGPPTPTFTAFLAAQLAAMLAACLTRFSRRRATPPTPPSPPPPSGSGGVGGAACTPSHNAADDVTRTFTNPILAKHLARRERPRDDDGTAASTGTVPPPPVPPPPATAPVPIPPPPHAGGGVDIDAIARLHPHVQRTAWSPAAADGYRAPPQVLRLPGRRVGGGRASVAGVGRHDKVAAAAPPTVAADGSLIVTMGDASDDVFALVPVVPRSAARAAGRVGRTSTVGFAPSLTRATTAVMAMQAFRAAGARHRATFRRADQWGSEEMEEDDDAK